ncbi:MAG: two-component regulator propeller domain-containing protein [Flavisolibacter sp.]
MQIKLIKLLLSFLFIPTVFVSAQNIPYEKYTTKNGLISDRITAIAQDEKGYMWFGSYFGVCRYNGISFEKIALPEQQENKYVTCMLPVNNKMYIAFSFQGGLVEYNSGKLKVYNIEQEGTINKKEFYSMTPAWDSSIILCTGMNEIYQFKNGKFKLLYVLGEEEPGFVRTVMADADKNIWLGTNSGLRILSYPYKTYTGFYPADFIMSIAKDKNGKIWITRNDHKRTTISICDRYNNSSLVNEHFFYNSSNSKPSEFSGNPVNGMWLVEGANILTNINSKGEVLHYKVPQDLNTEVKVMFTDREKNLWISNEPGIRKFTNFSTRSYFFNELAFGGGALVRRNDSSFWASNAVSLYTISNRNVNSVTIEKPDDYIGLLHVDSKKNLWVGYWSKGVSFIQWNKDKVVSQKYFSGFNNTEIKAQSCIEDHKGNMWIAGLQGIFRIKNNEVVEHIQPKNFAGRPVFVVAMTIDEDAKTLWLGDNDQGVVQLVYNEDNKGQFSYEVKQYINAKQGLTDNYIRGLLLDHKKNLWIGTRYGGIYQIKNAGKNYSVTNLNAEAGLACTRISQIIEQDTTAVWFSTCNGVYKYQFKGDEWHHFNVSDGLLNAEVYSCALDKDGKNIWVLTSEGVVSLPIHSVEKGPEPLVNLTAIKVLGKPDTAALFSNKIISYPYEQNSIGFDFAGPSFIDEKKIRYRYMLTGYDKDWSAPVTTNSVNYASLPPGPYVFKVIAENAKGQWSQTPAIFRFEITMPFYKRTWFLFLVLTVLIFVVYFIRMQRLRQRFRIEKLRLNIARDLHDDIGSTLGSINILSKTATRKLARDPDPEEITPIFEKIGRSAENTLEAMDDIVWSINPDKDTVQDLIIRMREYAIPLFEAKEIRFDFAVEGDSNHLIAMNLRRNAFLIYKESIHNILKHSNATDVQIRLLTTSSQLVMSITDNGKGFIKPMESNRNGMKNMDNRAENVNGAINISSSANGTQISFTAPIR